MKNLVIFIFLLSISLSSYSQIGIKGSKHDFSSRSWSDGEICKVCHIPHGAPANNFDTPLWNHSITSQTYIPYTSNTLKSTPGQPDGLSKLCLSCHDGTVAVDSSNGLMGTEFVSTPIGPNLNHEGGHWQHPISFIYDSTLALNNPRLNDPISTTTVFGGTIQNDLLSHDKVQCSSCHDIHNDQGLAKNVKIAGDNLCSTCHKN